MLPLKKARAVLQISPASRLSCRTRIRNLFPKTPSILNCPWASRSACQTARAAQQDRAATRHPSRAPGILRSCLLSSCCRSGPGMSVGLQVWRPWSAKSCASRQRSWSSWSARVGWLMGVVVVVAVAAVVESRIRRDCPEACTSAWDPCGFAVLCIERTRLRRGRIREAVQVHIRVLPCRWTCTSWWHWQPRLV